MKSLTISPLAIVVLHMTVKAIPICVTTLLLLICIIIWHGTKARKHKKELERNKQDSLQQKELYDAKTTLLDNVTQEIRTPLTRIKMPIDKIIKDGEYTEQSKEDIFTIKANTDRVLGLINQYLDIQSKEDIDRASSEIPLTSHSGIKNKFDQEFMDKLHNAVIDNIANEKLNSEMLCKLVCTSKSTLYRKIKANTGQNINEYIRSCRLKKAAEMLASQKYRINEVGYLCGFSSASYFATCFYKQFNISPSNFVKKLKESKNGR